MFETDVLFIDLGGLTQSKHIKKGQLRLIGLKIK